MKTAEQILYDYGAPCPTKNLIAMVKAAQLDAMKEGMRRQRKLDSEKLNGCGLEDCADRWCKNARKVRDEILADTAAEQLKESDIV